MKNRHELRSKNWKQGNYGINHCYFCDTTANLTNWHIESHRVCKPCLDIVVQGDTLEEAEQRYEIYTTGKDTCMVCGVEHGFTLHTASHIYMCGKCHRKFGKFEVWIYQSASGHYNAKWYYQWCKPETQFHSRFPPEITYFITPV